ncbi:alanyl-tRNA editing protein Aarsd1 [Bradysia coprophila]|uniref:alanyl-tRNA editing protein Aarsd1 n=1 Tax=Bradysia coprophila TaxID=38358 RepID=UPI00187DAB23|nr:alanyl-tRNA editing protein Aarsd1 [Bradysia coprophila]XP_037029166.1 alanyl-tRNA editing protein Aarsd1 [Bradysia coprophila]
MVFKCQEDSYLKEFATTVVRCEPTEFNAKINNDDASVKGYEVVLEDTIIFPEGGGQPCDHGLLNEKPVLNVIRKGAIAIHYVQSEDSFNVGDVVQQKVDWDRRFDHMQQHSGQHLITAIFEQDFGFDTTTWNLGSDTSFVELDTSNVTPDQLQKAEQKINKFIAEQTNVSVVRVSGNEKEIPPEVTRATRGLPKDHVGDIRVVTFDGIESNMCCGTHVKNLAELQMVKLLNVEKCKGRVLVHFVVGNRVLKKLAECFNRELETNVLLKCGPPTHLEMIQKIKENLRTTQRTFGKVMKELAVHEADKVKQLPDPPKYYCLHRSDGIESDFFSVFTRHLNNKDMFLLLTSGDESSTKGQMLCQGKVDDVDKLGRALCELLDGKGNGKNGRFQGKVNNLKKLDECRRVIREYFDK